MDLKPVFAVSEFNQIINRHLDLLGPVTVEGEISELNISQNKWLFATIKDSHASLQVFGVVYQLGNLSSLGVGMQVRIIGNPRLHQKSSRFSLFAQQITPSGHGAIALAYERLKLQLEEEGLFDPSAKRSLPRFPQKVGLITARGSQAYQDFIKITNERIGGVQIFHYPAQVQGEAAIKSLRLALDYFNNYSPVDAIVITRGGGSLEDLIAFNDETLTRAVAASKIPVLAAIGHEGNLCLVEMAADLRASTPSNAAQLLFVDRKEAINDINSKLALIAAQTRNLCRLHQLKHQHLIKRLVQLVQSQVQTVKDLLKRFYLSPKNTLIRLKHYQSRLLLLNHALTNTQRTRLRFSKARLQELDRLIQALDFQKTLNRGFSLTLQSSKPVSRIQDVAPDQPLETILSNGQISSIINQIKPK